MHIKDMQHIAIGLKCLSYQHNELFYNGLQIGPARQSKAISHVSFCSILGASIHVFAVEYLCSLEIRINKKKKTNPKAM